MIPRFEDRSLMETALHFASTMSPLELARAVAEAIDRDPLPSGESLDSVVWRRLTEAGFSCDHNAPLDGSDVADVLVHPGVGVVIVEGDSISLTGYADSTDIAAIVVVAPVSINAPSAIRGKPVVMCHPRTIVSRS